MVATAVHETKIELESVLLAVTPGDGAVNETKILTGVPATVEGMNIVCRTP